VICCEKHFHFVSTGFEIAGDIIETGEGVKMFSKGDRVFGFTALGGFAEECVVDERVTLFGFHYNFLM